MKWEGNLNRNGTKSQIISIMTPLLKVTLALSFHMLQTHDLTANSFKSLKNLTEMKTHKREVFPLITLRN